MGGSEDRDVKLSKEAFEAAEAPLRRDLLDVQSRLMDRDFAVIIVINGVDPEPGNEVLNTLFEWFDPRYLLPHALRPRSRSERRQPILRRYWKQIPPDGRIAVFLGGWVLEALGELRTGRLDPPRFAELMRHAEHMERQLVAEGTHIVKLWVGPSPLAASPVLQLMRGTDWELAGWEVIASRHRRNRRLAAGRAVADSIHRRLEQPVQLPPSVLPPAAAAAPRLADVDLSRRLASAEYRGRRGKLAARLARLSARCAEREIGAVCVFEGWDAAGKGGAIRRLARAMDARNYKIVRIGAPSVEEKRRPHLWRFWISLPRPGVMTLYDRSWYGRVLVERVEGFASAAEWRRGYGEIVDFEEQVADKGYVLCKFWLHIDRDEQLRRFREREATPYKQYKITPDDWRNREKWDEYVAACDEMLARTHTPLAPWTLVAANDKRHARVQVMQTLCDALKRRLKRDS